MTTAKTAIIAGSLLVAAFFLTTLPGAKAQTSPPMVSPVLSPMVSPMAAPGPSLDCFPYLVNASDCLTYVEAGSKLTTPDKGCCPELAGLVESQPICLCQLLGNSGSLGVQIDLNKALKLPSVCGVSTPSASLCSAFGVPIGAPTASEGATSPGVMAPQGSAANPAPGNNNDNGAPSIAASGLSFLVGLAIVLLTTFF